MEPDALEQTAVDRFVGGLLERLVDPAFTLEPRHLWRLVRSNALIANLIDLGARQDVDAATRRLLERCPEDPRLLILLSPRSGLDPLRLEQAVRVLSETKPELVASWASSTFALYPSGLADPTVAANLRRLVSWPWLHFGDWPRVHHPYFGISYVDPAAESRLRSSIHRRLRLRLQPLASQLVGRRTENRADPRRMAILSSNWRRGHVVHRTLAPLVEPLKSVADVTLVHFGPEPEDLDREGFTEISRLDPGPSIESLGSLAEGRFGLLLYPDVGLHPASILLTSLRLAPVQVHAPGHPVAAPGSELDVYVSGEATEAAGVERTFEEDLILLPGRGACHRIEPRRAPRPLPTSLRFPINLSWSAPKVTVESLALLRELAGCVRKKIVFRFFSTGFAQVHGGYLAFRRAIEGALPEGCVQLMPFLDHQSYLEVLAGGALALDAFPFGGSNTVTDSLSAGLPVVTREGDQWRNRIGAALLRACGLDELIVPSREGFLELAARLIEDDELREGITARVRGLAPDVLAQPRLPQDFSDCLLELSQNGGQRPPRSRRSISGRWGKGTS